MNCQRVGARGRANTRQCDTFAAGFSMQVALLAVRRVVLRSVVLGVCQMHIRVRNRLLLRKSEQQYDGK